MEKRPTVLVKYQHVKGHKGIKGNEEADKLARAGARKSWLLILMSTYLVEFVRKEKKVKAFENFIFLWKFEKLLCCA